MNDPLTLIPIVIIYTGILFLIFEKIGFINGWKARAKLDAFSGDGEE